ncbi:hypothetical protein LSH36_138g07001 [Paralvinella palmiformis]|uniref:Chitin-binding type-2 domain-containing protein n=1 Tax=Paralvinella palmiformis TaxID=53620 RepID=A0AAD9JXA5_9ANNE|nr:hypothetical protein LSH36_138g07001 [Paralvinella palmiformis]
MGLSLCRYNSQSIETRKLPHHRQVLSRVIRTPKFLCQENGYFLNPYNCSGFYLCVEGIPEWHPCPDHLEPRWVNPQEVHCDIPEHVNCTSLNAEAHHEYSPNSDSAQYESFCSGRKDGLYQDQLYCYRFVMCASGSPMNFYCPDEMRFDGDRGICIHDDRCTYSMAEGGESYDRSSGEESMTFSGMGSVEVTDAAQMGSGEDDIAALRYSYVAMENKRIEELKKNIDSVLKQVRVNG